jgi:hypothetical protein
MSLRTSFSLDGIGIAGIILATVCLVLDKAGKLKGGLLIGLLCLAGIMTLFLAIGNSFVLDAPSKWKLWRGLLMFSLVIFTYSGLAIWITSESEITDRTAPAVATASSERQPHIQATLVIDSIKKDIVLFHIHVKNIGSVGITNLRWRSQNERFASSEIALDFVRTVPPQGELDIQGFPGVFMPHATSSLLGAFTYALESDAKRTFYSMYRFVVFASKPTSISPEAWVEKEGSLDAPVTKDDILNQWNASEGTISFGLDEAVNGKPNVVEMTDRRKTFRFDPVSGDVIFSLTRNSEQPLILQRKLRNSDTGRHRIVFGWSYEKHNAFLLVDGDLTDTRHIAKPPS